MVLRSKPPRQGSVPFLRSGFIQYPHGLLRTAIWKIRGEKTPAPNSVKQAIVREHLCTYGISTFIETGTYLGDMVFAVRKRASKIISIEISEDLASKARARFSKYPEIRIIHGDSSKELPNVLPSIEGPCLFWLDAHYSGGITEGDPARSPISEEIEAIMRHASSNHVILLDDARLFRGDNGYPSLDDIKKMVNGCGKAYRMSIDHDIIRLTPE